MAERKIAKANRGFKGIWIPAHYWLDANLTIQEMLFLAEIDSLDIDEKGCYASNKHFSDFFGLTTQRCSQVINSLKEKDYISIELIFGAEKQIEKRVVRVVNKFDTPIKYSLGGYQENVKGSNTGLSNTSNKRRKRIYDESSSYYKAAVYFKNLASKNFEFKTEPNIQKWSDEIRKLVELDKYSLAEVKAVMDWCQQDNFWFKNIRSTAKLRAQFDSLLVQAKATLPKTNHKPNNFDFDELEKIVGDSV